MKPGDDALLTVTIHFLSLSFLAIGGVIATLPEMQRIAVDLEHWMTAGEFAEMFALAQIAPGPNMMIVTLIGFRAAGCAGRICGHRLRRSAARDLWLISSRWVSIACARRHGR